MMTGIIMAQKLLASVFRRVPQGMRGPLASWYLRAMVHQAAIRKVPMISPGTMPERNSLLIEVLVVTP